MIESFSKQLSKQEVEKEISTGIKEYLRNKIDQHTDIEQNISYNKETAERPLTRAEFEEDINNFIKTNFNTLLSLILTDNQEADLNKFKIFNKDLGNFGFGDTSIIVKAFLSNNNYEVINEDENVYGVYTDRLNVPVDFNYDLLDKLNLKVEYSTSDSGDTKYKLFSEIMATAYLKEEVRVDSKLNVGDRESEYAKRFFYRKKSRYLCKNDFGMKPYGEQADVSDISPFAQSAQRQIRKVLFNIESVVDAITDSNNSYSKNLRNSLEIEYKMPEWPDYGIPNRDKILEEHKRINSIIDKKVSELAQQKIVELFASQDILNLILNAIPYNKFINEIESKNHKKIEIFIDKELGAEKQDLYKRLEFIKSDKFKNGIRSLILENFNKIPELEKIVATSKGHSKPVILTDEKNTVVLVNDLVNNIKNSFISVTEDNIISAHPDSRVKQIISNTCDGWSNTGLTRYAPKSFAFFTALKKYGVDEFLELYPDIKTKVLEENGSYENYGLTDTVDGILNLYQIFGKKINQMDLDKLKKEIWHYKTLEDDKVWKYFAEREVGMKSPVWDYKNENSSEKLSKVYASKISNFFENLSQPKRRKLFFEGKQMYWLAKNIKRSIWEVEKNINIQRLDEAENHDNNSENEEFKFYQHTYNIDWEQYDCKNINIEKLGQYLSKHGNIIGAILASMSEDKSINLIGVSSSIVEMIESGIDMRGIALAFNKKQYIDDVLSGKAQQIELEDILDNWPKELRDILNTDEFQIYFENADEYLYQDPNGMIRYANFLQKDVRMRQILGDKAKSKSDLDLRFCLSIQAPDVMEWYIEGAEYLGHAVMHDYFVRFHSIREQTGGYSNLHDLLYWVPNIKKVEPGEAKALLYSISTVDESNDLKNFLPRYNKERDQFKTSGTIESLRELKKRVLALEANIDLASFSPEIIDIISAPGFNLSALKSLQKESRFTDLIEGRLDKDQPFKPHVRKFTKRPLSELLREGLGSYKDKIRGTAQNPKGLFNSIRNLIQDREINGRPMEITDLLKEVPLEIEEDILNFLQMQKVSVGPILEATIHAKSDPEGWVCGNYTDCCMDFGESNNTDYMFNKGTQYFTVKQNGRIIAQSVIVDSIDNRTNETVVVLDNIEVAKNYQNQSALLSKVYKTFWSEYTSNEVKIGTGHSDLIPDGAKPESNTYSPKYPLSYSDSKGPKIYNMPKISGVESLDNIFTFANLTENDVKMIADIEKQAYSQGLIQGKDQILEVLQKQREIELPGAASSFVLRKGSEVAGYLLVLVEESEINSNEEVAHIYDIVVLPKFQNGQAARKMMERVFDTAKAYDIPAIEFEARESTSYRLITNSRIAKWIESKGYKLTYDELLPEYLGGENFYYVRLDKIPE